MLCLVHVTYEAHGERPFPFRVATPARFQINHTPRGTLACVYWCKWFSCRRPWFRYLVEPFFPTCPTSGQNILKMENILKLHIFEVGSYAVLLIDVYHD